jgi:hypothetical protein
VPAWIIKRPELINVRNIGTAIDPQVRRCMIEILTPARFVAEGGAVRVSTDETGVLWRQRWRWEAWAARRSDQRVAGTRRHVSPLLPAGAGDGALGARGRGVDVRDDRAPLSSGRAYVSALSSLI